MITLTTGLPGSGKTLYTIAVVKDLSEKEHRPVFYSGIKDLTLPWHELKDFEVVERDGSKTMHSGAELWNECPDGAIIIIDECQRLFRPRGNGAAVPEFVSALETHRHKGFDIFIVTQHPMLIDANVRRLTERHFHVSRRFGMQRATILIFESCKDQPLAKAIGAQRQEWRYPKEVFSYYKSAELHTVKRRIPMVFWVAVGAPVCVGLVIWYFVRSHYQDGQAVLPGMTPPKTAQGQTGPAGTGGAMGGTQAARPKTVAEYLTAQTPRVGGLAHSAPYYDELTKPENVPIPTSCIKAVDRCKCYSQQSTRLQMDDALCVSIVERGFFEAFPRKFEAKHKKGGEV